MPDAIFLTSVDIAQIDWQHVDIVENEAIEISMFLSLYKTSIDWLPSVKYIISDLQKYEKEQLAWFAKGSVSSLTLLTRAT